VAKHGHDGGWESLNHVGFVNLKKKYSGDQLYRVCATKLLHTTYEDAAEHDEWYEEYQRKLQRKKQAILRWKSQKKRPTTPEVMEEITKPSRVSHEQTVDRELQKYQVMLWKVCVDS
jgi:hypothetical protein